MMKFLSIENIYILEVCDCEVCYIQVKKNLLRIGIGLIEQAH